MSRVELHYDVDDKQAELRAVMRMLKNAKPVGFMRWRFSDDAGRVFTVHILTGYFSVINPDGTIPGDADYRGWREGYPTMTLNFMGSDGKLFHRHPCVHKVAMCLDPIQRGLHRQTALYAMAATGCSIYDIDEEVNHADGDTTNAFSYDLEWTLDEENLWHKGLMKQIPILDSKGRSNRIAFKPDAEICQELWDKLNDKQRSRIMKDKLRKGIYMSAQRVPDAFGDFLINGANGAMYKGEPYAKFISRAIDAASFAYNIDFIRFADKKGREHTIEVAGRTVWQIIGDCWAVRAIGVIDSGYSPISYIPCQDSSYLIVAASMGEYELLDTQTLLTTEAAYRGEIKTLVKRTLRANRTVRILLDSGVHIEIPPSFKNKPMLSVFNSSASFIRAEAQDAEGIWDTIYERAS